MAEKKKNHFVPESYLKRFSKDSINVFSKIKNEIRLIPFGDQNQKDNLYSLGRTLFKESHNLFEDFLGEKVEGPFNADMRLTIDKGDIPQNEKLVSIVHFAIIQSCRPLIYKSDFEENFKAMGLAKESNPLLSYGFIILSMINGFWEKIKTCSIEILRSSTDRQFITSDNPSTLWVPMNQRMTFIPITIRFLHENNPDLELIMPLSPSFLLKVYLNRPRPDKMIWDSNFRGISDDETTELNARINYSKHKVLYSIDEKELKLQSS